MVITKLRTNIYLPNIRFDIFVNIDLENYQLVQILSYNWNSTKVKLIMKRKPHLIEITNSHKFIINIRIRIDGAFLGHF